MVGVMTVMVTSFKRTYAHTVIFSASDPTAGQCCLMPPLEIPGHSQASLAQSLVRTLLLSHGTPKVLFVPSKSPFPQLCGSSIIKFPTGLQSQIPCEFPVPLLDPQVGKSVVGPGSFATV